MPIYIYIHLYIYVYIYLYIYIYIYIPFKGALSISHLNAKIAGPTEAAQLTAASGTPRS